MPRTFYIGIKGLIVDNNKVLILKCKDTARKIHYWDLPGGRMEDGETIAAALQRELREELPIIENIKIHNLITAYKLPRTLPDGQGLMLLMYKVTAHLPTVTLSNEHIEYKWVSKDELELIGQEAEISAEYQEILYRSLE